jgi:hypothetical protein
MIIITQSLEKKRGVHIQHNFFSTSPLIVVPMADVGLSAFPLGSPESVIRSFFFFFTCVLKFPHDWHDSRDPQYQRVITSLSGAKPCNGLWSV